MTKRRTKTLDAGRLESSEISDVPEPIQPDSASPAGSQEKHPAKLIANAKTIRQALDDLGIDRPYYSARVVGNRLELALYGGDVVVWPAATPTRRGRAPSLPEEDA